MEEIVRVFHLDLQAMIGQLVNFGIVFFALYKFAYRPILKKMNERTETIEKGIKDAQTATKKLLEAEKEKEEQLIQAKKEAKEILQQAMELSEKNRQEMIKKAKIQAGKIVDEAKKEIEALKIKTTKEVKAEIGQLVALATEQILKEKASIAGFDQKIIDRALRDVERVG